MKKDNGRRQSNTVYTIEKKVTVYATLTGSDEEGNANETTSLSDCQDESV